MAKTEWHMVRVSDTTYRQLVKIKGLWEQLHIEGWNPKGLEVSDRYGITLDRVIAELCSRDDDHRKRGRRQGKASSRSE